MSRLRNKTHDGRKQNLQQRPYCEVNSHTDLAGKKSSVYDFIAKLDQLCADMLKACQNGAMDNLL